MAINPETQYPGKIAPSTPEYPYGAARNITVPGDGTGTPWEAALVNDLFGFQQALLADAGVVPSGTPDNATTSQYLDALKTLFPIATDFTINARRYGLAEGNTPAQNGLALRNAIDAAAVVVANTSVATVDLVTAFVWIPSGVYEFDYIQYKNGVELVGQSMSSTVLMHKGTGIAVQKPDTNLRFNVWLRNLTFLGEKIAGRHGFEGYGLIRTCGLEKVFFDGFDRNIFNTSCWTFQVDNCQGQNALSNNIYWDGATNAKISGGRFDGAGADSIVISNDTINTEAVLLIGVASQASQGAGVVLNNIKTATLESCFLEALKQDALADKAYLHADMDGTGNLTIDGCYMNKGGSGGDGLAGVFIDNVKNFMYSGNTTQSQAVGLNIGAGVEAGTVIESGFGNVTRYINNSTGFINIKEGFRPQINNGVDLNDSPGNFDGNLRSSHVAGVAGAGYVAAGAYNGIPALQGGGAGSNFRLILNPFEGDVEAAFGTGGKLLVGATRRSLRATASNINSQDSDNLVQIDTTGGGRSYTLRSADVAAGREITIKRNDPGAINTLTIATEGAETIDGAATIVTTTPYDAITVYSDGTDWFRV